MPTKSIKVVLGVENVGGGPTTVSIDMDGTPVFSNTVAETGPVAQGTPGPTTEFTFEIDINQLPLGSDPSVENRIFTITPSGGDILIDEFSANYTKYWTGDPAVKVIGTADDFQELQIVAQPLWDGVADLTRYNINENYDADPPTGPGQLLINDGEACQVTLAVTLYNDGNSY